jgi:hypothetical protein
LKISILNFFFGELTITVDVHSSEDLIDGLFLLLAEELGSDESIGGLLQLGVGIEVLKIG